MVFVQDNNTSEKRDLAQFPALIVDHRPNINFLGELGTWFEDHFAFRSWFVSTYAMLEQTLFDEASIRNVIAGKDDWLFYQETLDNYLGLNPLTDRQIFNIVHNLGLYQYALNQQGAKMMVTIVPNKNTIYPEYMKDRYLQSETSDLDRMVAALNAAGIPYTDLKTPLQNDERTLYYKRDSHWTNEGALLAYNVLMDQMGIEHDRLDSILPSGQKEHISDLDEMLNPKHLQPEIENDYSGALNYQLDAPIQDYMDNWIATSKPDGQGTLLMFRDSFGEAIAPFFANHFANAWFSRLTPYNLIQIESLRPQYVIFERAERRMAGFQEQAAIMNMPVVANMASVEDLQKNASLKAESQNDWYLIGGKIENLQDNDEIYLQLTRPDGQIYTYPVFYINTGYQVYLPKTLVPDQSKLDVLLKSGSDVRLKDSILVSNEVE